MQELKPCPFCGAQPFIVAGMGHEEYIVCQTPMCANEGNYVATAEQWNRRADASGVDLPDGGNDVR